MVKKALIAFVGVAGIVGVTFFFNAQKKEELPVVAIANYGPHASLEASIRGLKNELSKHGFVENKTVRYEIADVGFDPSLIPQMVTKLKEGRPKVIVVKTTLVAQFAKGRIHDIPLVYCDILDPIGASLIKFRDQADENITGSSDQENFEPFLNFVKKLLPNAKTVGVLYSTAESNDAAMLKGIREAASRTGFTVLAIPLDQARDVPVRMQEFRGKADFVYVGTSGPIQPTLPAITVEAQKMGIPVFNAEDQAVRDGIALASYGVNYESVGKNAGKLVIQLLNGADIKTLAPIYPAAEDYNCFINKKQALYFNITIPQEATVVE
jgi:putative ABC transport system substrate-binding protein